MKKIIELLNDELKAAFSAGGYDEKYAKVGLDKVMLDCDVENLGSSKTMEALGGKLERTEIDPYDGILTSVYWINVDESLEKYKDEYVNFIDKSYGNKFMK